MFQETTKSILKNIPEKAGIAFTGLLE